jgi:hypothetical protein
MARKSDSCPPPGERIQNLEDKLRETGRERKWNLTGSERSAETEIKSVLVSHYGCDQVVADPLRNEPILECLT